MTDPAPPPTIFICYAGPDAARATALAAAIEAAGGAPWLDTHHLTPGDHYDEAIPAALEAADRVAVLVTPNWPQSWHAPDEVARAIDHARAHGRRHIVPVLCGAVTPRALPYGLARIVPLRVDADDWHPAAARLVDPAPLPLEPPTRRPRAPRIALAATLTALTALALWHITPDPPTPWPGPAPVDVRLPTGPLRVDANEATRADLGDCHRPTPPPDQTAWCAALRQVIDPATLRAAIIPGHPDPGARIITGLAPTTAERICTLRGMRLPTDAEFLALAATGDPAPHPPTVPAAITADVRGPARLQSLATGAIEWTTTPGGYLGRGTPMLSAPAHANIAAHPQKLLGDLTHPRKREPTAPYADFGFRCVADP